MPKKPTKSIFNVSTLLQPSIRFNAFMVIVIIIICCFSQAESLKIDTNFTSNRAISFMTRFKFEKAGHVLLAGTAPVRTPKSSNKIAFQLEQCRSPNTYDSKMFTVGCTGKQQLSLDVESSTFCGEIENGTLPCEIVQPLSHQYSHTILSQQEYFFYLLNCEQYSAQVHVAAELTNPKRNELSGRLNDFYPFFFAPLAVSLLAFIGIVVYFIKKRHSLKLYHLSFVIYPLTMVCYSACGIYFFHTQKHSGSVSTTLSVSYYLLYSLSQTYFLFFLITASQGFGHVVPSGGSGGLEDTEPFPFEFWPSIISLIAFGISSIFSSFNIYYFIMIAGISWIATICLITRSVGITFDRLWDAQLANRKDVPLVIALNIFAQFRLVLLLFVGGIMALAILCITSIATRPGIAFAFFDVANWILFACVAWIFRFRDPNAIYTPILPHYITGDDNLFVEKADPAAIHVSTEVNSLEMSELTEEVDLEL